MKPIAALALTCLLGAACQSAARPARESRPAEHQASLEVLPLRHAVAAEVAAALKNMLRDVRIVADVRTNSLIVSYEDEAALAQVERCVAELDVEVPPSR